MSESAQFFSVVIQASAGILAIIVALITVLHSIGVEERTPRTQELHSDLVELSEKYHSLFQSVSLTLTNAFSNDLYQNMMGDYNLCDEIVNNPDDHDSGKLLQAHVYRIEYWLSEAKLRDYHKLTEQQLNALSNSAEWLLTKPQMGAEAEELYEQITGQPPGVSFQFERIFPPSNNLRQWIQGTNRSPSHRTLSAYMFLFHSFGKDALPLITRGRQDTLVDYQSPIDDCGNTVAVSILIIAGILVPLSFLISIPIPIWRPSPWALFIVQLGVVILPGWAAAYLFRRLWSN